MLKDENGRAVLTCDRCPVRLDVGLYVAYVRRSRLPTGWLSLGDNKHQCSLHDLPTLREPSA